MDEKEATKILGKIYKVSVEKDIFIDSHHKNTKNNSKINVKGFGFYDKKNPEQEKGNRYYLELEINELEKKEEKKLIVIMMNPSKTYNNKIDASVANATRLAYKAKEYSKIVILNSFPLIDGNGKTASKTFKKKVNDNENNEINNNLKFIEEYIKQNLQETYLIAWGDKVENRSKLIDLIKQLKYIKTYYGITNKGNPYHCNQLIENKYKAITNFKNLISLEIDDNKFLIKNIL